MGKRALIYSPCVEDYYHTFDDELVMKNPLQRPQKKSVERKVAHFAGLKIAVDLFKCFVALKRLL